MEKREEIGLHDVCLKLKGVNVNLDNQLLKTMLSKASDDEKPHCNLALIKKLNLKPNTRYSCYTIYGWIKYQNTVPLEKLNEIIKLANFDWKEVEKKIISINAGRGIIRPKFPMKVNRQMGSIVGHILGDGSIDKRYKQVFFSNSEKALLKEFSCNMNELFHVEPRIWMQKAPEFGNTRWDRRLENIDGLLEGRNGGLFYPTICGLMLNAIFGDFAIGKDKKITSQILNSNVEFRRGLIRAFYDDECNVGKKSIRLFQDDRGLLEIFRGLLKEFGIIAGGIKRYIKRDKERFYFDIFRKSNFLKFKNEIGFTSPKKGEKLEKLNIILKPWNAK
ncbi:MAG: LAGLIDADG family homing endonuclease [Nanoarchaeota archaeon]